MENINFFCLQQKVKLQREYRKLIRTGRKMGNVVSCMKEVLLASEEIDKIELNSSQNNTKNSFSK